MAEILYAPIIQEVPAFSGDKIVVYFEHNRAVSVNDRGVMALILKNDNNTYGPLFADKVETNGSEVYFYFNGKESELNGGEYYKCQIAYADKVGTTTTLHWSSIAITRYLKEKPTLTIEQKNTNSYQLSYTAAASAPDEILYKYCFTLQDTKGKVIQTSGWKDYYENQEEEVFVINKELQPGIDYELILKGKTINDMELKDTIESISQTEPNNGCSFKGNSLIENHVENGYIQITITNNNDGIRYELLRKRLYTDQLDILTQFTNNYIWQDYSVEQGAKYKYFLRDINEQGVILSKRVSLNENEIIADFEDIFLSDANRQLKIKFNPQISTLKNTLLEQKIDTIGNQYPFFFRNGNVKYKEIPISGLISYHMDDQGLFMTAEEIAAAGSSEDWVRSTNLTPDNFTSERKFKMEVLDWLTNGKPKLFRSPAEGNYVVRLMNTSLSPNPTVGRMLHTFSTTGYECMPADYDKMIAAEVVYGVPKESN